MSTLFNQVLCILMCSIGLATYAVATETPPQAQEVLTYWFGPLKDANTYPKDKGRLWFGGGEAVDNEIRNRFGPLVVAATKSELDAWKETPRGRLALIILLDQMTRNIYRGTAQAFAYDGLTQEITLEGLAKGDDNALFPIERIFMYLPLEHAENLDLQELSLEKFHSLIPIVPKDQVSHYLSFEDYAKRHYDIIAKFGRFPHRNKILNRESTPEEIEFLKSPGSSF